MKLWNKTMRRRRDNIVMWYTDITTALPKTIGVRQSTVFYTREGIKISGYVWTGPKTVLWGPIHMYQFLFENGYFFSPGLTYRPHVCLENGHRKRIFSKNALHSGHFWKRRLFVYVWTDKNGGYRIRWCHTSYTSSMTHVPIVFALF